MPILKTIYLQTNFNNKLACEVMVHLDIAPRAHFAEPQMDNHIIEFRTQDNSCPATRWHLVDLYRLEGNQLSNILTWPSHGMDAADFYGWFKVQHEKENVMPDLAVFYYKRNHD